MKTLKILSTNTSIKHFVYTILLLVFLITAFTFGSALFQYALGEFRKLKTPEPVLLPIYKKRLIEITNVYDNGPYDYEAIFIGDSFANDLFKFSSFHCPKSKFLNLGIPNDTTSLLLDRLDKVHLMNTNLIVLIIGSNDVGRNISVDVTIENMQAILQVLEPFNVTIVAIPLSDGWQRNNRKIRKLNKKIYDVIKMTSLNYVDSNLILSDENKIKNRYTSDGIHLSEGGNLKLLENTVICGR